MRSNPRDWRIDDLKVIATRLGIEFRQKGTSHVTFRSPQGKPCGSSRQTDSNGLYPAVGGAGRYFGGIPMSKEEVSNAELRIDEYPFTVRRLNEDEGTGYLIEYPDVPGCMSDGATPEEAVLNGRDALRCKLLTKIEFGDPIPDPGSIVSLAVPAGIHDRLSAAAEKRHVRPAVLGSALIAEALDKEPAA